MPASAQQFGLPLRGRTIGMVGGDGFEPPTLSV